MNARSFSLNVLLLLTSLQTAFAASGPSLEFEENNNLPIVYLNLIVDVGTAQDPADKLGLAHISSQMLLRGTQKHSKKDFYRELETLGGQINVDNRPEGTVIRASVLSENLQPFLSLLEEALVKPKLTAEELKKLKAETESAILEQMSNDQALAGYHFLRYFYGSHPYGNPPIGTRKTIEGITSKDILDFQASHFGSKTLTLIGYGDAKENTIEDWFKNLTTRLDAIHPEAKPSEKVKAPEIPENRRALLVDKPGATQSQVLIGGKGLRPEKTGFYSILLANHSFGGSSFEARMMQELRVKRGWTYGASSYFRFGLMPKHFVLFFFPKTDDTVPAIELSLSMFSDYVKNGITMKEYEFAKDSLVNNAPFNYDTAKKRLENRTTEYLFGFEKGYFEKFADRINQVEYSSVAPTLKSFFNDDQLTLTVVGDGAKLKEKIKKIRGFEKVSVKRFTED